MRTSLRTRMIAASVLWILIGSASGYWLLSSVFRSHISKTFYSEIVQHVHELDNITTVGQSGQLELASDFSDTKYNEAGSGYYWEVRSETSILSSPSLSGKHLQVSREDFDRDIPIHRHRIEGAGETLLLVEKSTRALSQNDVAKRILVGVEKRHFDAMAGDFNTILAWAFIALSIIMILAASLLIRYALHPFSKLSHSFNLVRTGQKNRLEGTYPKEVSPIVDGLNSLLETSEKRLKRARAQAGNLAHGLKGSLSIITDEAYRLEAAGRASSAVAIIEQSKIMQRHIDHHIARARATAAAQLPGTAADIESVLVPIISAIGQIHSSKSIRVDLDIGTSRKVHVDKVDLSEIFGNILDNAYKAARHRIGITARDIGKDRISICFDDDGAGLPEEAYEAVFELGGRWDESGPGDGLGLTIVRELTQLYYGECHLEPAPGGGLRVEVILPCVDKG